MQFCCEPCTLRGQQVAHPTKVMHVMPNLGNRNRSPVIKAPAETEDIEIVVAALADPDAQALTDAQPA
jgi:hypothetical protein